MHIENIVEILWPILLALYLDQFCENTLLFPIIRSQVVGTDSQCLSSPRPSSQNLRVHYEIVPLKLKF